MIFGFGKGIGNGFGDGDGVNILTDLKKETKSSIYNRKKIFLKKGIDI